MPKIILHTKEYYVEYENRTSVLLKIITKFKSGFIVEYRHVWLPKNKIEYREKQYLDKKKGEFLMIYELPKWLIDSKDLWDYHYPSTEDLKRKIKYLRSV